MLKTGIQYLPVDSIQTSVQEYLASQAANSPEPFGKGRKAGLLILCTAIGIGNTDAGIDPGFVDVKATAVVTKDFKHRVPPVKKLCRTGRDWSSGEIESTSEEISLRATGMRQSLMP